MAVPNAVPCILRVGVSSEEKVAWLSRVPCVAEHVMFEGVEFEVMAVLHGNIVQGCLVAPCAALKVVEVVPADSVLPTAPEGKRPS